MKKNNETQTINRSATLATAKRGVKSEKHTKSNPTRKNRRAATNSTGVRCPRCAQLEAALSYSAAGKTLLSKFLQAVKDRDAAIQAASKL